jgi:hypothetical protein
VGIGLQAATGAMPYWLRLKSSALLRPVITVAFGPSQGKAHARGNRNVRRFLKIIILVGGRRNFYSQRDGKQ